MKEYFKEAYSFIREVINEWQEDNANKLAAALSFYTVFSLAPLLIIATGIAGLAFGDAQVREAILVEVEALIGDQGAEAVKTMLEHAGANVSGNIVSTIIGLVTLLVGSVNVFNNLQSTLNLMWDVQPEGGSLLRKITRRIVNLPLVLAIGFLLLVSLIISTGLSAFSTYLQDIFNVTGLDLLLQLGDILFTLTAITILFALMFKILPNAKIRWRDVVVGAIFTALLFLIGNVAIGLYIGHSGTASAYGAAGSLVVLLLWIYYSAQIVFIGAEFTQVYARRYGQRIQPA